jgi:hypothetical protein
MGFNFPHPPSHLTFSPSAQTGAEIVCFAALAAFLVFGLVELRRLRSPLMLALLLGGAIAYFNEPFDDTLGLVWFARPHEHVVIRTLGPVPLWGLPTYMVFFGGVPYLFLKLFREGRFTVRRYWMCAAAFFLLDVAIEVPVIHLHLYSYYSHGGKPPMEVGGFPLYWMLINVPGPVLAATILYVVPQYFRGWRAPLVTLLPLVTYSACGVAVGLPVYSALHAPHSTELIRWGAAFLSVAIGLLILDALSKVILARTRALQADALPAVAPSAETIVERVPVPAGIAKS